MCFSAHVLLIATPERELSYSELGCSEHILHDRGALYEEDSGVYTFNKEQAKCLLATIKAPSIVEIHDSAKFSGEWDIPWNHHFITEAHRKLPSYCRIVLLFAILEGCVNSRLSEYESNVDQI